MICKLRNKNCNNALHDYSSCNVSFGSGYDIGCYDNCNTRSDNHSSLGHTYDSPAEY